LAIPYLVIHLASASYHTVSNGAPYIISQAVCGVTHAVPADHGVGTDCTRQYPLPTVCYSTTLTSVCPVSSRMQELPAAGLLLIMSGSPTLPFGVHTHCDPVRSRWGRHPCNPLACSTTIYFFYSPPLHIVLLT